MSPTEPWPFVHFTDPATLWAVLPSFVVGQLLFMGLALLALVHAWRRGRAHLMVWVGALVAGTANDLIFMALPLVDNFWHSQGLVMLGPRLPLYIPCVYVCFMYLPTVAVRDWGLGGWRAVGLTGLLAALFYAPFDIVGAKLLWWTWHDTDAPIAARILGAPTSSSLWVLTFAGAFAGLVHHSLRGAESVSWGLFAKGLLKLAALTTLVMMLQMTLLQQLDGGTPAYVAIGTGVLLYGVLALRGGRAQRPGPALPVDRVLLAGVVVYFATLLLTGLVSNPEAHASTGVHQEVGECYVEQTDITGLSRFQYLCLDDFDEDFDFSCVDEPPAEGSTWFTVCGVAHEAFGAWIAGLAGLCGLGAVGFFVLLGGIGRGRG